MPRAPEGKSGKQELSVGHHLGKGREGGTRGGGGGGNWVPGLNLGDSHETSTP